MDTSKYTEKIELKDPSEAEELVIKIMMQEGALRFQEQLLSKLKSRKLRKAAKIVRGTELEL